MPRSSPPKTLDDLLARVSTKPSPQRMPATAAELERLVLPRYRDGSGEAPPPKTLRKLLALDRKFTCWGEPIVTAPKAKGPWRLPAATISDAIREVLQPFEDYPAEAPIWNDDPKLPALVPLPSGGDQRNYLYVTTLDEDGEYPIVSLSDLPEVFLSRASLAEYVAEEIAGRLGAKVDVAKWFKTSLARAKKRHAKAIAKETWSDDPRLAHFLETGELPDDAAPPRKARAGKAGTTAKTPAKAAKTPAPEKATNGTKRDAKALLALRKLDWWTKEYKAAARAFVADAASYAEADLFAMVSDGPWHASNTAARMIVARAGARPDASIARLVLAIDRRRERDRQPEHFEEGWGRNGFGQDLSIELVKLLMKEPEALASIQAATVKAGVAPDYEKFVDRLLKRALKTGKVSVALD